MTRQVTSPLQPAQRPRWRRSPPGLRSWYVPAIDRVMHPTPSRDHVGTTDRSRRRGPAASRPAPSRGRPGRRLLRAVGLPLLAGLSPLLASCSSSPASPAGSSETSQRPLPAGPVPSEIAKMVCQPKVQREINETLGVRASVSTPTWIDHLYSCRYRYPDGEFVLSVKELSSWGQTKASFASLGQDAGQDRQHRQSRPGGIPNRQRVGGRPQGLEDPDRGHLGFARPVRQAADQPGGRRGDRGRSHPGLLGRGLTPRPPRPASPQNVTAPESTCAGQPIAPGEPEGGTVITKPRHISSDEPSPHVT